MSDNKWTRLGVTAAIALIAAVTAATITVTNRLSNDALAVLAGSVCGVGAAIPTSLLIIAISRRHDQQPLPPPMTQPMMMITPPMTWPQPPPALPQTETILQHQPTTRTFTIVGEE